MNQPPPNKPRQRLQALLAIPEGQRTEAQWDELNELEIMLAPGNRTGTRDQGDQRNAAPPAPHGKPRRQRSRKQDQKHQRPFQKGNGS